MPIFDDVTKLTGTDVGTVDVITGGFPCQDISAAGAGAGIGNGTRSGLFREIIRLAQEVGRPYIIFENVPRLLSGPADTSGEWFGEFLWSLAEIGYDAEWFCITAASIGAPHVRERVCIVAYPNQSSWKAMRGKYENFTEKSSGWDHYTGGCDGLAEWEKSHDGARKIVAYPNQTFIQRGSISSRVYAKHADLDGNLGEWSEWGGGEPEVCGVDDGIPKGSYARRNGMMGNAIVPQVFAIVMRALREAIEDAAQ